MKEDVILARADYARGEQVLIIDGDRDARAYGVISNVVWTGAGTHPDEIQYKVELDSGATVRVYRESIVPNPGRGLRPGNGSRMRVSN